MTDCPGWELDAEDHQVLSQLTRSVRAVSGLINSGTPRRLAKRLSMDERQWIAAINELIHTGFIERHEAYLYVVTRCLCEYSEDLPRVGAKSRKGSPSGPVRGPGWGTVPSSRRIAPRRGVQRGAPPGAPRYLPVGEVAHRDRAIANRQKLAASELDAGRKGLAQRKIVARSVVNEPSAKSTTSLPALRSLFGVKVREAKLPEQLKIVSLRVLDDPAKRGFVGALKNMREVQGLSNEQIVDMMDVFVAMVLSREISVVGKDVWRVFVANRVAVYERMMRTQRTGSAHGKLTSPESKAAQERMLRDLLDGGRGSG